MTEEQLKEFDGILERIKAVPGTWSVLDSGKIRHATLTSSTGDPACPLCAATGRPEDYDNNEVFNLGIVNCLHADQTIAFMNAADLPFEDVALRGRILEACKLTLTGTPGETA